MGTIMKIPGVECGGALSTIKKMERTCFSPLELPDMVIENKMTRREGIATLKDLEY